MARTRRLQGASPKDVQSWRLGRELLLDLNDMIWWAGTSMVVGEAELAAGDPAIAYEALAEGQEELARSSETGYLATIVGYRAQCRPRAGA